MKVCLFVVVVRICYETCTASLLGFMYPYTTADRFIILRSQMVHSRVEGIGAKSAFGTQGRAGEEEADSSVCAKAEQVCL